MEIKKSTIVVTGAASGLGASTAKMLAEKGARLALIDVQEETLREIADEIGADYYLCDVVLEKQAEQVIKQIVEKSGSLHGLINCAGIAPGARIVGRDGVMPLDSFRRVIEINLIGSFNMMRVVMDVMTKQEILNESGERGIIINTASVAAYEGQIGQTAYAASKAGIIGMTLPAAREMAQFGVRVMTIAPGLMETPMLKGMPEKVYQSLIDTTLFPHRLGRPEEYAHLVCAIVENPLLNGETIRLDGAIRLPVK